LIHSKRVHSALKIGGEIYAEQPTKKTS
jgi:hypothetical protein